MFSFGRGEGTLLFADLYLRLIKRDLKSKFVIRLFVGNNWIDDGVLYSIVI